MENENNVNALSEEPVVEVQEVETTEEVESVESEVATDTQAEVEKPKQDKETNSQFAEVRKRAAQEAQDKLIEDMYGKSHNIHSKAEYDKAMKEQRESELIEKMKNDETDPDTVKQELYKEWEKSDPRLQEYEKIKTESYTTKQLSELNADLKDMGLDAIESLDDIGNLPSADKVIELVRNGRTLSEAYFLANKKSIIQSQAQKIQTETLKKTMTLDHASPGALDNAVGSDQTNSVFKLSKADFEKMTNEALMGRLRK